MLYELVDDTMTYAGNVPEIFSMHDPFHLAPSLDSNTILNAYDDVFALDDKLNLAEL